MTADLIPGWTVTVVRPGDQIESDPFNASIQGEDVTEIVDNVVIGSPTTADLNDSIRPDGVRIDAKAYFPKEYRPDKVDGDLTGCKIIDRGQAYRVVGSPLRWPADQIFGSRDLVVDMEAIRG